MMSYYLDEPRDDSLVFGKLEVWNFNFFLTLFHPDSARVADCNYRL